MFKYTSNQQAIKRVRNDIKADLLALEAVQGKCTAWPLRAQGRILLGRRSCFVLALVPMLVMMVPVCLLLGPDVACGIRPGRCTSARKRF